MKEEFTHIIQRHQGIIHKVCRIYRDRPEDREDLFQEILFQLWKAWPSFRGEARVSSWMYKIALSTAIARFRKKTKHREAFHEDMIEVSQEESTHPGKERLYRAIRLLSDADKALITLYLDDYSYQEMADILGITINYVGVKLKRIREKLTQKLNPQNHES